MFGFGKSGKPGTKSGTKSGGEKAGKKPSREDLLAQARENARQAREQIGEDTLQRVAAAMKKKEQSAIEQAKNRIKAADKDKVVDHLKWMIEEDKPRR